MAFLAHMLQVSFCPALFLQKCKAFHKFSAIGFAVEALQSFEICAADEHSLLSLVGGVEIGCHFSRGEVRCSRCFIGCGRIFHLVVSEDVRAIFFCDGLEHQSCVLAGLRILMSQADQDDRFYGCIGIEYILVLQGAGAIL